MKLSVVILNYNVRYFLELCIKSVKAALVDLDSEIIVVDNNSSDNSCAMVRQLFPEVILIESKENTGFSKGNNIGVAQAKGKYLCILNPDTVIAEDTFIKLLNFADTKEDLGIIGCRLIDGSGTFLPESKRHIPTPLVSFKKMFGDNKYYYVNNLAENSIGNADVLVGAFMFLKRNLYLKVHGFDEDYFMYGEDIDLSYRILKAGFTNYYYGKTTCIHFKGESTPKDAVYIKRFYNAMKIFYKKHFKGNLLFDLAVYIGLKTLPLFKRLNIHQVTKTKNLSEIILDNNRLTFKQIIKSLEKQNAIFKIKPKNSNFVVLSNCSKNQGNIELLDD